MDTKPEVKIEDKLILSWDTLDIAEHQVEFLVEQFEEEEGREPTDDERDQMFQDSCGDSDVYDMEWECEMDYLTEVMNEISKIGVWSVEVEGFGWQGLSGQKRFEAETGEELIQSILPNTDCNFWIYARVDDNGNKYLAINNTHHDSPMRGKEWYYVYPAFTCNVCGYVYRKGDGVEDEEDGLICLECVEQKIKDEEEGIKDY